MATSPSPEMEELARRVEAATEGDRKLSCTIAKAIGWRPADGVPGSTTSSPWAWCPDFTERLDAAMKLVPEGWVIASLDWWPMRDRSGVALREVKDFEALGGFGFGFDETCGDARSEARTPALSVAAAALRARARASASNPDMEK